MSLALSSCKTAPGEARKGWGKASLCPEMICFSKFSPRCGQGTPLGRGFPSACFDQKGFAPVVEMFCKLVPEEPSGNGFAAGSASGRPFQQGRGPGWEAGEAPSRLHVCLATGRGWCPQGNSNNLPLDSEGQEQGEAPWWPLHFPAGRIHRFCRERHLRPPRRLQPETRILCA